MAQMVKEFNTSTELIAASVAVYLAAVGVSALFWGPASDKFGRKAVYMVTIISFIGTTLGCIFSPNVTTFVICRVLQGLAGAGMHRQLRARACGAHRVQQAHGAGRQHQHGLRALSHSHTARG